MPFTTYLSMLSTLAIVAGGIFAGVQLRQLNKQRARDAALQLVHSFRTPDFLAAANITVELPEGLSRKEIETRLGDKMTSVDRKSTRLNSSHANISYAVFCLKKKKKK